MIVGDLIRTSLYCNGEWRAHKIEEKEGLTGAY